MYLPLSWLLACSPGIDLEDDSAKGYTSGTPGAPCDETLEHSISTSSGCVVGQSTDAGEEFLGIPFAAPPVGKLRFAPPEPVEPWSEPLYATEYGPVCLQQDGLVADIVGAEQSEDCLSLNFWRPPDAEGLPIIVHIHGGSHTAGSGRMVYPGHPRLAENAILVTLQYRLGALGFLAQSALSAENTEGVSGDQAILDNILALQWINENAEVLGGDPDNVTVWGFSAGGSSTCALLESPLAAGLMDRVFIESALCGMLEQQVHSENDFEQTGEKTGDAFAVAAGCTGDDADQLACLRDMEAEDVLAVQLASPDLGFGILRDGYVLPDHGLVLLESGEFNRIPVIAGNVADEMRPEAEAFGLESEEELADQLRTQGLTWGINDLTGLTEQYTVADYGSVDAALSQFMSDVRYVCPTRIVLSSTSAWVDAYSYWFTHLPSASTTGAVSHGSDLTYWLANGEYADEAEASLASAMAGGLESFAQGAPTMEGLGDWPLSGGTSGDDTWVELGDAPASTTEIRRDACTWLLTHGLSL